MAVPLGSLPWPIRGQASRESAQRGRRSPVRPGSSANSLPKNLNSNVVVKAEVQPYLSFSIHNLGCPVGRAAYIAVDGNAQECLPGPDMCSDGYECVRSIYLEGRNICCSKEESTCADNEELVNGQCVVKVKPGGGCHNSEECGGGSSCIDSTCT